MPGSVLCTGDTAMNSIKNLALRKHILKLGRHAI